MGLARLAGGSSSETGIVHQQLDPCSLKSLCTCFSASSSSSGVPSLFR